jgi:Zn-dependent M28 family amino/carboxypeptidase
MRLAIPTLVSAALAAVAATLFVRRRRSPAPAAPPGRSPADASRLEADVRRLTEEFRPRSFTRPANLTAVADWIAGEFANEGGRVTRQLFTTSFGEFENVIGSFGEGELPALVVGAHYDAFSMGDDLPGADDNASGTAGLAELARLLGEHPPARRVDLVAYANEEPPFFGSDEMGSAVHAESLARAAGDLRPPMICLEMIGYFTPEQPPSGTPLDRLYPPTGDFVIVVGRADDRRLADAVRDAIAGAAAGRLTAHSWSGTVALGMDLSDHRSYWLRGFEAVMVTDTAYLRNPNYHTPDDTADTLDYQRMAAVVDGIRDAVYALAGEEIPSAAPSSATPES